MLEADASGVPLLALTADRPPELRGTGANQTIDQPGLYGGAVRWAADVGVPEAGREAAQNRYWRSLVAKALITAAGALSGDPGPVHLNLALREPLMPDDDDAASAGPWARPARRRAVDGGRAATGRCACDAARRPRTLVIAGDGPVRRGRIWPSGRLAADRRAEQRGVGRAGRAAGRCCSGPPTGWPRTGPIGWSSRPPDPVAAGRRAARRPGGAGGDGAASPALGRCGPHQRRRRRRPARTRRRPPTPAGSAAWQDGRRPGRARRSTRCWTPRRAHRGPRWRATWSRRCPPGALLVLGSSTPVRDVDRLAVPRADVRVLANRGVAGIDGTISTAVGRRAGRTAGRPSP